MIILIIYLVIAPKLLVLGFSPFDILQPGKVPLWSDVEEPEYQVDERIVGGKETNIEEYPHQVSFIFQQGNGTFFCGGFIISEYYILTAAHCSQGSVKLKVKNTLQLLLGSENVPIHVNRVDPTTVVLRAGSTYRNNGTIIPIDEIVPHPEYDDSPFDKDVGYIRTSSPIEFSDTMQPIPLVGENEPCTLRVNVSGWGRLRQGQNPLPLRLRDVNVPVVDYFRCRMAYPQILTRNMVCIGNYYLGGKGTCQGDSGGAVVENGRACGIVSFARGCAAALSPSVCTNIAAKAVRTFIFDNTGV